MYLKLNVKKIAIEQGLDKSKLSRRADLNLRTIDRVWYDPDENIQKVETDTLEKLAKALNVSVKDIIAEDDPDTNQP